MSAASEYERLDLLVDTDPIELRNEAWRLAQERDVARGVLGDLIDALHDEVRYEVGQSAHVLNHIEDACRMLGGAYEGYVGDWL